MGSISPTSNTTADISPAFRDECWLSMPTLPTHSLRARRHFAAESRELIELLQETLYFVRYSRQVDKMHCRWPSATSDEFHALPGRAQEMILKPLMLALPIYTHFCAAYLTFILICATNDSPGDVYFACDRRRGVESFRLSMPRQRRLALRPRILLSSRGLAASLRALIAAQCACRRADSGLAIHSESTQTAAQASLI